MVRNEQEEEGEDGEGGLTVEFSTLFTRSFSSHQDKPNLAKYLSSVTEEETRHDSSDAEMLEKVGMLPDLQDMWWCDGG